MGSGAGATQGDDALAGARRWFTSFGSCCVTEPLDDLVALGLLEESPTMRSWVDRRAPARSSTSTTCRTACSPCPARTRGSASGSATGCSTWRRSRPPRCWTVPPRLPARPSLNRLMAEGRQVANSRAGWITGLLTDEPPGATSSSPTSCRSPTSTLHLPVEVGDYVDFYASLDHATNVGRIFRPDAEPLLPNWRHLPVGYHGRSGTVVPSGTAIVRPRGQRKAPSDDLPTFGPSARLDIEAELGFVVGTPDRARRPRAGRRLRRPRVRPGRAQRLVRPRHPGAGSTCRSVRSSASRSRPRSRTG